MGLACSQARLLTLTARKADTEFGISVNSMHKMALTREMSELSQDYYSKLQSKNIAFYQNGKYSKINYEYLMGYGAAYTTVLSRDDYPLKKENNMILTDYKGRVVLSDEYSRAIKSVLGAGVNGGTFSIDTIPAILAQLMPGRTEEEFQTILDEGYIPASFEGSAVNTLTGEDTGRDVVVDNSETNTKTLKAILDFYYPIFLAAATNGWTTDYNQQMKANENYISDAIVTGTFQLAQINEYGQFDEGTTLTYFITRGLVEARTDSNFREDITAWYNAEKDRISEKETLIDLEMSDLSTELESIKTEIQSIQSLIDDAVSSVFDWGSS